MNINPFFLNKRVQPFKTPQTIQKRPDARKTTASASKYLGMTSPSAGERTLPANPLFFFSLDKAKEKAAIMHTLRRDKTRKAELIEANFKALRPSAGR